MGIGEGKARSSIGSAALTPAIQIERASRPAKSRLSMLSHSQRRTEPSTVSRREPDAPHPPGPPPPPAPAREGDGFGGGGGCDARHVPSLRSSFRRGGGRRESVGPARQAARRPGGGDRKQTGCCAGGPGRGGGSSRPCGRPRWRRPPPERL